MSPTLHHRLDQARAQHGIAQVGDGFVDTGQPEVPRPWRLAEARELGEDVPDPVARLPPGAQLESTAAKPATGSA